MKKTLSYLLKLMLPAIIIGVLLFALRGGKNVLEGIYIIFPLIFIFQGIFCSDKIWLVCASALLSEAVLLIFINVLYHMGSCIDLAIIYAFLCAAAYFIKSLVLRKKRT
jgi:hypothetical protein